MIGPEGQGAVPSDEGSGGEGGDPEGVPLYERQTHLLRRNLPTACRHVRVRRRPQHQAHRGLHVRGYHRHTSESSRHNIEIWNSQ